MSTAVILAGGQSRRFGQDKAFFKIGKRPMIRIVADTLTKEFEEVFVAGGDLQRLHECNLTGYPDPVPGKGALGGIYNGLTRTKADWIFFCGCDMPLIKSAIIRAVVDSIGDEDILMPIVGQVRQPLHAVYKRTIIPAVRDLVHGRDGFLPDLLPRANVRYLNENLFSGIPDYEHSFASINDLATATQYRSHLDKL